jgi:flagellar motility protein MotE (MotC chaperone)
LAQLQGQDGKDLADILIKIDKIETQLKKKTKEFFVNDENLINYFSSNKIYEDYEALTPEVIAKRLSKVKDGYTD